MATYYIDPANGSNSNSGTSIDDAYETFEPLHYDASPPGPGDTIKVRDTADVQQDTVTLYKVEGDSGNPIVIEPYEDESPTLAVGSGRGFFLNGTQHLTIRGLEIRDGSDGIKVQNGGSQQARGIRIEDCDIHDCGANAIIVSSGTHDVTIRDCELHHCNETENGDGLRVTDGVQSIEVRNCVAYHNADDGYDALDVEASGDFLFVDCLAYANGHNGDGTGFKIGRWNLSKSDYVTGGARLYRCAAYGHTGQGAMGFRISDGQTLTYNCTSVGNEGRGFMFRNGGGTQVARNNLSWDNSRNIYKSDSIIESNNTWTLGIESPQLSSTDPASSGFLCLQDGSPCVDAGTVLETEYETYNGSAPNVGWWDADSSTSDATAAAATLAAHDGDGFDAPAAVQYYDGSAWTAAPVKVAVGGEFVTAFDPSNDSAESDNATTTVLEGWERSSPLSDYVGDTAKFGVDSFAKDGTAALRYDQSGGDYLVLRQNPSTTVERGHTYRADLYAHEMKNFGKVYFHADGTGFDNVSGYCVEYDTNGKVTPELKLIRFDGGEFTVIASTPITPTVGEWMTVEFAPGTDGTIDASLVDGSGTAVASVSVTDSTYDGGTYGFGCNKPAVSFDTLREV